MVEKEMNNINIHDVAIPKLRLGYMGCEKTTYVVDHHQLGDLVLTTTKEGAASIKKEVRIRHPTMTKEMLKSNYRTITRYLMNGSNNTQYDRIFIDEAF